MTKTGLGMFLALHMFLAAGCATEPLDATGSDDPATEATAQPVLGPGNPFNYASARDEQLACFGIAAGISSNCRDIVDSDDKQMCIAMSDRSTTPCFLISDRNLLLACQAMAPGPSPFNPSPACSGITNSDMQRFCSAYTQLNSALCNPIADSGTRLMCLSVVSGGSSFCGGIANTNDSLFCQGVSDHTQGPCFSIH
jgi:hypothetical protein